MSQRLKKPILSDRNLGYTKDEYLPEHYIRSHKEMKRLLPTPTSHLILVLVAILAVFVAVIVIEKKLPPGLKIADEQAHPDRFIAERAMQNLIELTNLGPRVAGSHENEVLAVGFLVKEIRKIIDTAQNIHIITYDVQKSSGAFPLRFLDGFTNVYRDVQSVAVKVGSEIKSPYSLLLNCHFDSVADSPGASDDGAACAVMLELLRVLSKSTKLLRHNIIFLFNGAEENIMQASHGFVTQHVWAKEVKAFINLEACGAGGRELLFQAGPNNPWILETYSETVPYPYASSLAQEIFESGIIPGDTDYRIFRDFGNASGLDFAWATNGYVYHTLLDTVHQIPLGSLQRTGDNILALARGMANGHQMADMNLFKAGNLVFFDFLGAFVVRWPEYIANFINVIAIVVSIYSVVENMKIACKDMKNESYIQQLLGTSVVSLGVWVLSLITVLLIALSLTALGRTMSWFSRPVWLLFLYICPTVCISMGVILFCSRTYQKDIKSPWTVFQLYYDSYQLIWTFILFCGVVFRIRSGFIPLLWVAFTTAGNLFRTVLFKHWRDWKWLVFHIAVVFLPFTQSFYLILGALYLFVPIMGRSGAGNNSELMMAAMIGLMFSLLFSFITPLITIVRNPERILSLLLGMFLISMGFLILTPLGFPYSGDPNSPSPQRFMILHTNRNYHDVSGKVRGHDTGYWIVDLDINSPYSVSNWVPEMLMAQPVDDDCERELYCGMPYLLPVRQFIWKTHWIPGPAPVIPNPTTFTVTSRKKINETTLSITVNVTGPDHICIMLSPLPGIELFRWSLVSGPPLAGEPWNGRETYFIYYAYAAKSVPLSFTMDFKVPRKHVMEPVMDIAVTSHYLHGRSQTSDKFQKFLSQFPHWTAVTAWTATYTSYRV